MNKVTEFKHKVFEYLEDDFGLHSTAILMVRMSFTTAFYVLESLIEAMKK